MALHKKSKHTEHLEAMAKLAKKLKCQGEVQILPEFKESLSREDLLVIATMMGDTRNVEQYLKMGADANYQVNGNSLLKLAKAYGHANTVDILREYGATFKRKSVLKR